MKNQTRLFIFRDRSNNTSVINRPAIRPARSKFALLALLLTFSVAQPAAAADSCEIFLCMAGKAMGQGGGSACNGPIKDYFSIRKFKKGKFSGSRTSSARSSKVDQCSGADPSFKKSISNKFGSVYG